MPRFYLDADYSLADTLELSPELAHHMHVLRLQEGALVDVFNGRGACFQAQLLSLSKKSGQLKLVQDNSCNRELPYALSLVQGLPEGSKLDWIIEKAVELGVTRFQAIATQRAVVKLNAERAEKKLMHWQAIAIAASEQCGRNQLMQVDELQSFSHYVQQTKDTVRIMLSPRADVSLSKWLKQNPAQPLELFIGPEGGFSPDEEHMAASNGVLLCAMGERILRTETAGLAVVSTINAHWGGFE